MRIESLLADKRCHVLAFALFSLLMVEEYVRFVYGSFSYLGFDYSPSYRTVILGIVFWGLTVLRLFALPASSGMAYALSLFEAMAFCVPSIVMFQLGGTSIWLPVYSLLFLFLLSSNILQLPSLRLPKVPDSCQRWLLPLLALLLTVPFIVAYGLDINWNAFTLGSDNYELRAQSNARSTLLTSYLLGALSKVLLPVMTVYGLKHRKPLLWIFGILLMLYIFAVNPQKSLLFSVFVVIVFYFLDDCRAKGGLMLCAVSALLLAAVAINMLTGNIMVESIALRRMFFVPVLVADNYFTFYHQSPLFLSHSFLSRWMDYSYSLAPDRLMGLLMYNRTFTHCNTGVIADGFMNFGHLGAFFFVLVAALIFKFFEALKLSSAYFGVLFLYLFTLLNGALFTSLLTHGGLVLILVAMLFIPQTNPDKC